eukprot:11679-Chlamydomonas_euryale.AAC.11
MESPPLREAGFNTLGTFGDGIPHCRRPYFSRLAKLARAPQRNHLLVRGAGRHEWCGGACVALVLVLVDVCGCVDVWGLNGCGVEGVVYVDGWVDA